MLNHESRVGSATMNHKALWVLPALALATVSLLAPSPLRAQLATEIVGRVEGHDFTVEPPAGATAATKDTSDVLLSGSRLLVHSGEARIALDGGGEIVICGEARVQLLKSQGALTVALDFGLLHLHVEDAEPVSVFTPLVLATPVSIGGGARDTTIQLDQNGQMCLRATTGALRISQQLSGENILVPQFGGLTLSGGQLTPVAATAPGCTCVNDAAKLSPLRPIIRTQETVGATRIDGTIASPLPAAKPNVDSVTADKTPAVSEPIYKVIMPALTFNSASPEPPPDPSPETMLLVRSVKVKDDTVLQVTVEPKTKNSGADKSHSGVLARIGGFFRRIFGTSVGPGCAGSGCK